MVSGVPGFPSLQRLKHCRRGITWLCREETTQVGRRHSICSEQQAALLTLREGGWEGGTKLEMHQKPHHPTWNKKPQLLSLHIRDEDDSVPSRLVCCQALQLRYAAVFKVVQGFFCQVFSQNQLLGGKETCESLWILLITDLLDVSEEVWEEIQTSFAQCPFRPTVLLIHINEESEHQRRRWQLALLCEPCATLSTWSRAASGKLPSV